MKKGNLFKLILIANGLLCIMACTPTIDENDFMGNMPGNFPSEMPGGGGDWADDGTIPSFNFSISEWMGEMADDSNLDVIEEDENHYYEANTFDHIISIDYQENIASVTCENKDILCYNSGAYVTIDMATNSVSGVEIIVKGKSKDGGLKIYGKKKFKLTLNGVELTSQKGPAINSQCKKRMFVHLNEGTINKLTDVASYETDNYYLDATSEEDRKGCFFSEGNLIFSGSGALVVAGKYKHAIATDGYFWMRPGVTIAITEAAKNGIHVKGDSDDNIGIYMKGGLIYTNISADAGKGMKTDLNVEVEGGKLQLNTSGNAIYEEDENDTSSSAGIKTDGSIIIAGGNHTLKSIGTGGKGLNADGDIIITGGETTITTTGGKYIYTTDITSSPKGAKADGNVTISGGKLNIAVTGISDGSEGLESKAIMNISGGEVYVYAYDDAINAANEINISGGRVYAYASNNDGIDSNGSMLISGGLVIASGTKAPESGIDVDNSNQFKIKGGMVLAIGGTLQSNPASNSLQRCVVYNGMTASKGDKWTVLNASSKPIFVFEIPRTMSNASFLFSSPQIAMNETYTIESGGILSGYTDSWNGWYEEGIWSNGKQVASFTSTNVITTIGTTNGGSEGGGMGGIPRGW